VECLVAQRLVRLICPSCKAEVKNKQEILKVMERDIALDPGSATAFEGRGCPECRFTGFRGRTGIYEVLTVTESIRAMIMEHASSQQIKQKAIQEGMRTLRQDGFQKVISGETAFTEIVRVTQQAEIPEN
jgi:type II secretory ATPase GspE/PulE/Tfp pilus assembly ATPase PilB-like protein